MNKTLPCFDRYLPPLEIEQHFKEKVLYYKYGKGKVKLSLCLTN
jgi:hypothetical protein